MSRHRLGRDIRGRAAHVPAEERVRACRNRGHRHLHHGHRRAADRDDRAHLARHDEGAPGRTVPLKILMRSYRGDEVTRTVSVDVPVTASGSLTVMVADGTRLAQWEQREARQSTQTQGVAQLVRAQQGAQEQPAVRAAARSGLGRRRERRVLAIAAPVGAGRDRIRPDGRAVRAAPQLHTRRGGTSPRRARCRVRGSSRSTWRTTDYVPY